MVVDKKTKAWVDETKQPKQTKKGKIMVPDI